MEDDAISRLFVPIRYVGKVEAVRQGYQVYQTSGGDFLVFSPSSRGAASFHMTMVSGTKVESVERELNRGGVTSGSLLKNAKVVEAFDGEESLALRFDLLMALYILTALGRAKMDKSGRNLVFTKA